MFVSQPAVVGIVGVFAFAGGDEHIDAPVEAAGDGAALAEHILAPRHLSGRQVGAVYASSRSATTRASRSCLLIRGLGVVDLGIFGGPTLGLPAGLGWVPVLRVCQFVQSAGYGH